MSKTNSSPYSLINLIVNIPGTVLSAGSTRLNKTDKLLQLIKSTKVIQMKLDVNYYL